MTDFSSLQEINTATPIRSGRDRSFWMILLLSVITLGIYYVIYHFQVISELRRMRHWTDSDDYNPTLFFWMYLALTALWSLVWFIGLAEGTKTAMDSIAVMGELSENYTPYGATFAIFSGLYKMFVSALGIFTTYYFLRLNKLAAEKVNANAIGFMLPFMLYLGYVIIGLIVGVVALYAVSSSANLALVGLMAIGGIFALVLAAFFLWIQTELVNNVWLSGDFGDQPFRGNQYQNQPITPSPSSPTTQPAPSQAPPETP